MTAPPPPLSYEQTAKILAKLGDIEIVLIGGQAVNFWASYYQDRSPTLAEHGPYASKDIDFTGGSAAVRECAERLGGTARLATFDDAVPNTGTVVFMDDDGHDRQIDFLSAPAGLTAEETLGTSFPAFISVNGTEVSFRVMHPILCMESRAYNVAFLPGYRTAHARNQLRASVICAREYVLEVLQQGEPRLARRGIKRIFRAAAWGAGLKVYAEHGIDMFVAVIEQHPALPSQFATVGYPKMREFIESKRKHRARVAAMERERRLATDAKLVRRE